MSEPRTYEEWLEQYCERFDPPLTEEDRQVIEDSLIAARVRTYFAWEDAIREFRAAAEQTWFGRLILAISDFIADVETRLRTR